jgi:hypothetical protein
LLLLSDEPGDVDESLSHAVAVKLGALGAVEGEQDAPGVGVDEQGGDDGAKASGVGAGLEGV